MHLRHHIKCTIALQALFKASWCAHQFADYIEWIPVPFYRLSVAIGDFFHSHESHERHLKNQRKRTVKRSEKGLSVRLSIYASRTFVLLVRAANGVLRGQSFLHPPPSSRSLTYYSTRRFRACIGTRLCHKIWQVL